MTFGDWVQTVPTALTQDAVWTVEGYQLGTFVKDLAWHDVTTLLDDRRTRGMVDQLYRAIGSISASSRASRCSSRMIAAVPSFIRSVRPAMFASSTTLSGHIA